MSAKKENKNPKNSEIVGDRHFVHTKQRERRVRKGRMRRERLRIFLRFLFILAAAYVMWFVSTLPMMYLPKNVFTIVNSDAVQIVNNNIVSTHKILTTLSHIKVPNSPIYMAKTNEIEKALKQLPPVEDVYVRRYAFPARIQIIIKERIPVMLIAPDVKAPPVAYFSQDGKIVGREYLPLKTKANPLLVLSYGNKGDDYKNWDLAKINELQKIAKYIETYSKEKVEYIDCRNPEDIYVKIPTINIRLGKTDGQIFNRIARLPSILPQVKMVDSKIKYLDLSWEKVNYLKLE